MSPSPILERRASAFTLIELLVVLVVLGVLASGLALPLATQVQMRRQEETKRQLDEAKEALLGFAAAHARLPCPASASSRGLESFTASGDATNGECSNFFDGFLPAATLGVAPLDSDGYLRDAWGSNANRVRYAVFGGAINGVGNALTRIDGMQAATLAGLGAASHYLFICLSGTGVTGSGCGPAANQLTRRAAFVVFSAGANATAAPPSGSDEARNLDGDPVFVWHEASNAEGNAFDDILTWVPIHLVAHRLLSAGRLP
jgi:prepilin-type N-terminal cleavage/methylation domain-containing protein